MYMRSQWANRRRGINEFQAREELLGGASIYSHEAGNATPTPTFMDAARTVCNTNPVRLPISGEIREIFLPKESFGLTIRSLIGEPIAKVDNCGPDFEL